MCFLDYHGCTLLTFLMVCRGSHHGNPWHTMASCGACRLPRRHDTLYGRTHGKCRDTDHGSARQCHGPCYVNPNGNPHGKARLHARQVPRRAPRQLTACPTVRHGNTHGKPRDKPYGNPRQPPREVTASSAVSPSASPTASPTVRPIPRPTTRSTARPTANPMTSLASNSTALHGKPRTGVASSTASPTASHGKPPRGKAHGKVYGKVHGTAHGKPHEIPRQASRVAPRQSAASLEHSTIIARWESKGQHSTSEEEEKSKVVDRSCYCYDWSMMIVGLTFQTVLIFTVALSFMTSTFKSCATTPFYMGPDGWTVDCGRLISDGYSTCRRGFDFS